MRLIRIAYIDYSPQLEDFAFPGLQADDVEVRPEGVEQVGESTRVVLTARTSLRYQPKVTKNNLVVLDKSTRIRAERAIENYANLLATAACRKRTISSPSNCVALLAETADETAWLDKRVGLLHAEGREQARGRPAFDLQAVLPELLDRLDGVALLSEALAQDHVVGRFHDLHRLFERAFRASSVQLSDCLTAFLSSGGDAYTRDEVHHWIKTIRDQISHADLHRGILLESDVRPVIWRMEQAAYDVLLNKAEWRHPSADRRNLYRLTGTIGDATGKILYYVPNRGMTFELSLLDECGAFPQNDKIASLPPEWWCRRPPQEESPPPSIQPS